MTRRTYIYDHDLDAMVQIRGEGSNYYEPRSGMQIIRDIDPYRAAGADVAADGKRPVIGGRRQHRDFLRRNGYVEVGNEVPISGPREQLSSDDRVADIKRALRDW